MLWHDNRLSKSTAKVTVRSQSPKDQPRASTVWPLWSSTQNHNGNILAWDILGNDPLMDLRGFVQLPALQSVAC